MNLVEALLLSKASNKPIRRPIAKHLGSCRTGWLSRQYIIDTLVNNTVWGGFERSKSMPLVTESDLLALDWEVKLT